MTWLDAILLGALQGVTEFLPISSSGHLVLAQHFRGLTEQGGAKEIFFDGMLHLGTLLAVAAYFARDLRRQVGQIRDDAEAQKTWPNSWPHFVHLGVLVGLATLPAVVATVLLSKHITESFKRADVVAVNFLFLGAVLVATDVLGRRWPGTTVGPATTWWQALLVGMGQALSAVFRGLSRSGMTICTALLVGLERTWAVRFSFMMSAVASLGLGGLGALKALRDESRGEWLTPEFLGLTLLGIAVSALVGYLTIAPLIHLVRRCRLWWFAIYVWLVGGAVLIWG